MNETNTSRRALVAGAGIGGLCAAIALRQAGYEPLVLERTQALRPVGAGLWLWPNALAALDRIGVRGAIEAAGHVTVPVTLRTSDGRHLAAPGGNGFAERFGAPLLSFHRSTLHAALLAELGPERVRLGAGCAALQQDADGVTVRLEGGEELRADLLVGADGLWSTVREAIAGDEKPRYCGLTVWRAAVALPEDVLAQVANTKWIGEDRIFGMDHIGGGRVYWYGTARAPEGERGSAAGEHAALFESFGDWADPIAAVVRATPPEEIVRHDAYDRPELAAWSAGRVTLLGDAAHPMLPNLAQGACQAIEDAAVLGTALASADDVPAALRAYELHRRPRTSLVAARSRRQARLEHVPGRKRHLRDAVMRVLPGRVYSRQLARVVGYRVPDQVLLPD